MSTNKIEIEAIIFDYGNVISLPQRAGNVEKMAALCGMPLLKFEARYWEFRLAYDRGELNADTYWRLVGGEQNAEGISRLVSLDTESWMDTNEDTLRWIQALHKGGLPLALLSNMPWELSRHIEKHCSWTSYFQALIFSCDIGSAKPSQLAYRTCLEKINAAPEKTLFIDDRADNVEGARLSG